MTGFLRLRCVQLPIMRDVQDQINLKNPVIKKISPFPSGLSEAQTCTVHRAEGGAGIEAARIDTVEESAQELSVADISDDGLRLRLQNGRSSP